MPYAVEKQGDKWVVVNTETQEVKAHHDSQADADKQVRLLHMIEHERNTGG